MSAPAPDIPLDEQIAKVRERVEFLEAMYAKYGGENRDTPRSNAIWRAVLNTLTTLKRHMDEASAI